MQDINKKKIKLVGHSGCNLELEKRDEKLFVVKTAPDAQYSERLKKQHHKQSNFKHDVFSAPAVFDTHHDKNGNFGFSMEYVSGITLAQLFEDIPIASIRPIAEKFLSLVPAKHAFDKNAQPVFKAKIMDLKKKLAPGEDERLARALQLLDGYPWEHCAPGDCHGDLTLENILWKDGQLYLIDFLDSFYDSWMMDMGKLIFDIESLWSYRHAKNLDQNLKIRLSIFQKILLDAIGSLRHGKDIIKSVYHMALLHLVRVLPYTKDAKIKRYLFAEMEKLCNSISIL